MNAATPRVRAMAGLAEARLGDHLAHLFTTQEEQAEAAADLLAAAMARGERGLGLGSAASLGRLGAALRTRGVDGDTAVARGALQLVPHQEHYLAGGTFDPAGVRRAWEVRTEAAIAAGFTGLTVATDMDWALGGAPGTARLVEYEASLGLSLGPRLSVICQYDLARFGPEVVRGLLRSHAHVLHGGCLLDNPAAVPPEAALSPEPAAAEVERLLGALHAQAAAEAAVRRSEARFRMLAENARDLVYRYRLAPEPGFEYVSPSATAITGYTPEEHYADPLLGEKIVHPDDRDRLRALAAAPSPGPVLLRWVRKDGTVLWAEQLDHLVCDAAGRPVAIEGIARDVTERQRAEAVLQEAQRLAGLGRLAAGVAHELNSPLAWMGSNVHFVQEALAGLEAAGVAHGLEELREALAEVEVGVLRVRAIVGELQKVAAPTLAAERQAQDVLRQLQGEVARAGAAAPSPAASPARGEATAPATPTT